MKLKSLHSPKTQAERRFAVAEFNREVGAKVREKRLAGGMTLQDVAERLKIEISTVSRYESGVIGMEFPTFVGIAHVVGFAPEELLSVSGFGE